MGLCYRKGKFVSKKVKYRQCKLVKRTKEGRIETTSYIPEEYAIVGKILKLKDDTTPLKSILGWTGGWEVMSVGELIDEPPYSDGMIRSHRKRTGDSMRKER